MKQRMKRIFLLCSTFMGIMLISTTIGTVFLHQYSSAANLQQLLNHYSPFLVFLHTAIIVSVLWWWPVYIKHHAARNTWSDENIHRAINLKWTAFLILMLIDLLFLFG